MIKAAVYVLIGIALMMIESSVLSLVSLEFLKPDLAMPLVIYTTLFVGPQAGLALAVLLSLVQEILSNSPHGSILFTKVSVFIICTFLRSNLFIDSRYSFGAICGGFIILESFLYLALSLLSRGETKDILNVLFYVPPNAIVTAFFAVFIFAFIEYLNERYLVRE
jgi:hypothetical protein